MALSISSPMSFSPTGVVSKYEEERESLLNRSFL